VQESTVTMRRGYLTPKQKIVFNCRLNCPQAMDAGLWVYRVSLKSGTSNKLRKCCQTHRHFSTVFSTFVPITQVPNCLGTEVSVIRYS